MVCELTEKSKMIMCFNSSKNIIAIYKRSFIIHLWAGQIFLPLPPGMPRGQRENVCDKKGGTL